MPNKKTVSFETVFYHAWILLGEAHQLGDGGAEELGAVGQVLLVEVVGDGVAGSSTIEILFSHNALRVDEMPTPAPTAIPTAADIM